MTEEEDIRTLKQELQLCFDSGIKVAIERRIAELELKLEADSAPPLQKTRRAAAGILS
jgi:hypothetical protein